VRSIPFLPVASTRLDSWTPLLSWPWGSSDGVETWRRPNAPAGKWRCSLQSSLICVIPSGWMGWEIGMVSQNLYLC
jgi:hypothetical protein